MRTQGLGRYGGNAPLPQDLGASARAGLYSGTLAGTPGLRVLQSRASYSSKTYTGTQMPPPQTFIKQAGGTNSAGSLDAVASLKSNRSRSLGQMRGFPEMSAPNA